MAPAANGGGAAAGAAGAAVATGAAAAGGPAPPPMKFDHAKTGYPLVGRHASVACGSCHVQPATKVRLKADPLRRLPPGRPQRCLQDARLRRLSQGDRLQGRYVRPRGEDPLPARREARRRRLRLLPQGGRGGSARRRGETHRRLPRSPPGVRVLPRRRPPRPARDVVPDVPFGGLVPAAPRSGTPGSRNSSGRAREGLLRQVPRGRPEGRGDATRERSERSGPALQGGLARVLLLPQGPAPRPGRDELRDLPHAAGPRECPPTSTLARTSPGSSSTSTRPRRARVPPEDGRALPPGAGRPCRTPAPPRTARPATTTRTRAPSGTTAPLPRREDLEDSEPRVPQGHDFPLEGQHLSTPCASCHWNNAYKGTPNRCYDCHWIRRQDDLYRTLLGSECEDCHRPTSWTAVTWNHAARRGSRSTPPTAPSVRHRHQNKVFTGPDRLLLVPPGELRVRPEPRPPPPASRRRATPATEGPTRRGTRPRFDHSASFPLAGMHAAQPCATCHQNNVYKGTPRDCYGCHRTDDEKAANPNHGAAGFPTACDTCHKFSDAAGSPRASITHVDFVPARRRARDAGLRACHKNNVYNGTARDCYSCHRTDYQNAQNPNHVAAGFPTACDTCHKFSDPPGAVDLQPRTTSFPLAGTHVTQACNACHKNNVFKGTARDCYSCHRPTTRTPRTRHTSRPASRRPATPATSSPTRPGSPRASTTAATIRPRRHPRDAGLRRLPRQQRLQGHAPRLYSCHRTDFQNSKNPGHARRLPDDVRHLPQGSPTRPGSRRASTTRRPRRSRSPART